MEKADPEPQWLPLAIHATEVNQIIASIDYRQIAATKHIAIIGGHYLLNDFKCTHGVDMTKLLAHFYPVASFDLSYPDSSLVSAHFIEVRAIEGDLWPIGRLYRAFEHTQVFHYIENAAYSKRDIPLLKMIVAP